MTIGILGGTFDPVHAGHLAIAKAAAGALELDRVLLVPCASPPHKERPDVVSGLHRYAMLALAVAGEPRLVPSPLELERGGRSYTVDTLTELRRQHGNEAELFFIVGMDAFLGIDDWREPHRILSLARLVVVDRPGFAEERVERLVSSSIRRELTAAGGGGRVVRVEIEPIDVSSTEVRRRLRAGASVRSLVPPAVEGYIRKSGLYR